MSLDLAVAGRPDELGAAAAALRLLSFEVDAARVVAERSVAVDEDDFEGSGADGFRDHSAAMHAVAATEGERLRGLARGLDVLADGIESVRRELDGVGHDARAAGLVVHDDRVVAPSGGPVVSGELRAAFGRAEARAAAVREVEAAVHEQWGEVVRAYRSGPLTRHDVAPAPVIGPGEEVAPGSGSAPPPPPVPGPPSRPPSGPTAWTAGLVGAARPVAAAAGVVAAHPFASGVLDARRWRPMSSRRT